MVHSVTPADGLMRFIEQSPTPAHAVDSMVHRLQAAGFEALDTATAWSLQPGQGYYLVLGSASLIAWRQGSAPVTQAGLRMLGAHTDSPCLKVKPQAEIQRQGYLQLGVEVYGGALLHPWMDRDLNLAGRVIYRSTSGRQVATLWQHPRPIGVIPSLAIHLNREANKGVEVNPQKHLPVVLQTAAQPLQWCLRDQLALWLRESGHPVDQVLEYDLCFSDSQPPARIGLEGEFIAAARLDNLASCYLALEALIHADPETAATQLVTLHDHEEVGSASAWGAEGPMLERVLRRLVSDELGWQQMLDRSMMLSCDNAHALHPNFADRHDENHGPRINQGPVIKVNANQRYATDSETAALFATCCEEAQVPFQRFVVRSDMGCGSTIGPITATRLGVRVADIGIPQWAMHSVRETAGVMDLDYTLKAMQQFLQREALD